MGTGRDSRPGDEAGDRVSDRVRVSGPNDGELPETAVLLVVSGVEVFRCDPDRGVLESVRGLEGRLPTCIAADAGTQGRAWCGTRRDGVFRSDDSGLSWRPAGLDGAHVTALACGSAEPGTVRAGTEPSALWSTSDGGPAWSRAPGLDALPSSGEWAFPPRPETHHVRWISVHPVRPGVLWLAIEAGALVSTGDGGATWTDRVFGGPYDTHEMALHPELPDVLRVAAGDGYFESGDGGGSWRAPREGLEVGYLRSVAIDPGDPRVVLVSGASGPRSTYVAGRSDGRVFRRVSGEGPWERVREGWPDPPATIAPLLLGGLAPGEVFGVDERGVHRSGDGGRRWERVAAFPREPDHLRGVALLPPRLPLGRRSPIFRE